MIQVAPALISAAASLANTGINAYLQRSTQNYTFEQQKQLMNMQQNINQSYQRFLWNNSAPQQIAALKRAGLNPAMGADGITADSLPAAQGSVSTAPMPNQGFDTNSLVNSLLLDKQIQSINQDIHSKDLDNQIKEIEVENAKGEQEGYNNDFSYRDPETEKPIPFEDLEKWKQEHPGMLPELISSYRKGNKGRLSALSQKEEYTTLSRERKGREDDVYTKFAENSYKRAESGLQEKIANQKINDDAFLNAIRELPKQQLNELVQEIKNKGLEYTYKQKLIEYQDMSNKQFSETSLGRLIERLKDTDLSFGEKTLYTLTFIFNNLGTFMRPR